MPTPSLLIVPARFKSGKLYSQLPTSGAGDFTVTRATNATRVNASGLIESVASGIPRLDYFASDGTVGCPALLVEPSGSNLLQRSEEFENSYWTKANGGVTQNQTIAPDGLTTADKYVVNSAASGNANSPIIRSFSFAINTTYTLSLFVKKTDYDTASIRLNTTETGVIANFFNLASGTATNNQIQDYGNGWYRVWVSFTTAATVANGQVQLIRDAQVRDGVAGIFIWGAQLEVSSVPTSYIPTTTASVTRNADVVLVSGAVSGSIGQTSGTIYAEVDLRNWTASGRVLAISNGTSDARVVIQVGANRTLQAVVTAASGEVANIATASGQVNGIYKCAVAYASGDFAFYVNGNQIGTDSSGAVPACNNVALGKIETSASTNFLNDRMLAGALYNTRLTNAELAALTA